MCALDRWGEACAGIAMLVMQIAVVGCDRREASAQRPRAVQASAATIKSAPPLPRKKDPGIDVSDTGAEDWLTSQRPVLVDFTQGNPTDRSWIGIHIDDDGTVWFYRYQRPGSPASKCDFRSLGSDPRARDACHYANSRLVARLAPDEVTKLRTAVEGMKDEGRIGSQDGGSTHMSAALSLPGYGTASGTEVPVAGCSAYQWAVFQLDSPEARFIIDLFRRLRSSVPLGIAPCGRLMWERLPEIVPGVPGWWTP